MTNRTINYVVTIRDWNGHRSVECETEDQAWSAIGSRTFGGLYEVFSPTGRNCYTFVPD